VLRRRQPGSPAYRCPGYPVTPLIYLLASLAVAASSAWASPEESLYGLLIVGAGVPAYFLVRRLFASSGEGA
jgi:APA family basic amino acid/polyamine antiporter